MAIDIKTDDAKQLTVFTGTGELSFSDVTNHIMSFFRNKPTACALWDLRHAAVTGISSSQVEQIVELLQKKSEHQKKNKTAIVASRDETFGLARMLEAMYIISVNDSLCEVKVFRDIKKASHWLASNPERD